MSTEGGRTTHIADLSRTPEKTIAERPLKGIKAFIAELDWSSIAVVAVAAFAGQKLPLEQVSARFSWAFQAGSVPVRSVIIAVIFALAHAFWIGK